MRLLAAPGDGPRLAWPGKQQAWEAALAPPRGELVEVAVDRGPTAHRLIVGDNLPVLQLLLPELEGRVRAVVIDPPYNTGKDFLFADRFAGAGDAHAAWLNMLAPRLLLARQLLSADGVMFVSIDDREVHHLRLLLDEIFGPAQHVATVIWQKVFAPKNSARHFSADHEYVLVYAKEAARWTPRLLPRSAAADARYKNPDGDRRGPWASDNLCARNSYEAGVYPITTPSGRVIEGPPPGTYWRVSHQRFLALAADGRIWWGKGGDGTPRLKRFLSEVKQGRVPQTLWTYREVGHTQEAKKELLARLRVESSAGIFDTPKPTRLVRRMLQLATAPDRGDVVLDFFAGSGTTGEAVLQQNREDGGDRRFVLVELGGPSGIAEYASIGDMARARLAAAAEALQPSKSVDVGLRVLHYEGHG